MATGTIAQAVQPAIHDVTDGSVMRSWLNSPLSSGLEQDVYKATNILHSFARVGYLQPEKGIPAAVLQGAAGLAILSVVKVTVSSLSTLPYAVLQGAAGSGTSVKVTVATLYAVLQGVAGYVVVKITVTSPCDCIL